MSDARLLRRLDEVVLKIRRLRALKVSLACWTVLAAVVAITALSVHSTTSRLLICAGGISVAVLASSIAARSRKSDRSKAALLVEQSFPELDSRLLTAAGLRPTPDRWEFSYLQSELVSDVLVHSRRNDWSQAVRGVNPFRVAKIAAMLTVLYCLLVLPGRSPQRNTELAAQDATENTADPTVPIVVNVEPGHAEVERGTSLLVLARFPKRLPAEVTLVAVDRDANELRVPLRKSLDDPIFGGRIPEVVGDMTYHVEFDKASSEEFTITTFTYPELVKADAEVNFPTYTGLEPEKLEDVRRLTVVEGAAIDFDFELNKDVQSAALVDADGIRISLEHSEAHPAKRQLAWTPEQPEKKTFRLELTDHQGRKNRDLPEFVIQVLPNNPANLKVAFPARDVRVSPLEELAMQADASDDYGLVEYGLIYETPTGEQKSLVLGDKAARDEKKTIEHQLHLETLKVAPDELISYYFYADDIGPDGQQRRAFSDIFFSEIRPFEEIFREVPPNRQQQQQQQQQEQGETQSGQLLEVQRQIVTATWNLIRSESRKEPSDKFLDSTQVLFESQEEAIEMAEKLMEEIEDDQMKQHLDEATRLMVATAGHFADAINNEKIAALHDARTKAQAAYQALLKLNTREKQVQQSQQQQSQSQNSRQQDRNRQMKALELKNDRDRYETERQAQQQQQDQEARETLQVLNRLRELARRQEDLNEKIRDLENKLREATTEEEKAQLERELKRLQEEQEEMLRNLEELQQRMEREENRERMTDAREQVQQTRERVMRASEALKEQQTSRALTEGTRAQRELDELKEEFKQQTASQFADAVRDLRDNVRELSENQKQVAQAMNGEAEEASKAQRPTLRSDDGSKEREEIAKALEAQKEQLTQILDDTKELVEESEQAEPLLSKKLYDTMRDLRKFEPEESLQGAAQLQRYGIAEEAKKAQEKAQKGIDRLQAGVEDAARSILGDENEALAAASQMLESLTDAIENELRENAPGSVPNEHQSPNSPSPNRQTSPDVQPQLDSPNGRNEQTGPPGEKSENGEMGQQLNGVQPPNRDDSGQSKPDDPQQDGNRPGTDQPMGESQREPSEPMPNQGQPSEQQSAQSSSQQGQSQPNSQPNPSGQPQGQSSQQQGGQQRGNQPSGEQQNGERSRQPNLGQRLGSLFNEDGTEQNGGGNIGPTRPLTGEDFRAWSDQMRDLEEMVTTSELRSEVATIRDRARQMRIEMKRHSKAPDWELVRTSIYGPMIELQQQIAEEIAKRDPNERLVPIDRDPVPDKYAGLLQKYYEELAKQRQLEQ